MALDLPMGHAVGTSLVVIAGNSLITLIPRIGNITRDLDERSSGRHASRCR